jgi:DNA polymerase III subunit alpha
VPNNPANPVTLAQAIEGEPQLQEMRARTRRSRARLLDIAQKLEGLYRHASTHAAGVVIGDRPLVELVPLYRDPRSDMPVDPVQHEMGRAGRAGEVRLPRPQDADRARAAVELIARRGIDLDLSRMPLDDAKTYDALARRDGRRVPAGKRGHARRAAQA